MRYEDILNQILWSFSSVSSYENCPFGFKLARLVRDKNGKPLTKVENAFGLWGSFMHHLFELYFTGKVDFFELSEIYEEDYQDQVNLEFPPNRYVDLNEKYYEAGRTYWDFYEGLSEQYEVIGVELKAQMKINGRPFVGYIDLVLRDKQDGKLLVYDHKSKSKFTSKKELAEYARQLYLYAEYVKQAFGEYPKALVFNMFRAGEIVQIDFDQADCEEAKKWFSDTIDAIYADSAFEDKIERSYRESHKSLESFSRNDFFCNELCGVREHCKRSKGLKDKDAEVYRRRADPIA